MPKKKVKRVIIMGAAGRDFHNFNTFYKYDTDHYVVCFTATQIPGIAGRKYPRELAGRKYPRGIPIYPEEKLPQLIRKLKADKVVFSYSDVAHEDVMHKASIVLAAGANFLLLGPNATMLKSKKPVISVCAVRTGCGKSSTTQKIAKILNTMGYKVGVIRHPMPYGNLVKQRCQKFSSYADFRKYNCTIEEREEYEPYIEMGLSIYAGVDYEMILRKAEKENDIILWDGGNNDFSFIKPDLNIVVADPHRAGHEIRYHPGETNFRMAEVIIINKEKTAPKKKIALVKEHIQQYNPRAIVIDAASEITVVNPDSIRRKKVLVIEDGPTLTHGGMPIGAGYLAAKRYRAKVIDPRKYAVGSIKETYKKFPHLGPILPAMGYSKKQMAALRKTINRAKVDAIVVGNPINLARLIKMNKPSTRVKYQLQELQGPTLKSLIMKKLHLRNRR